MRGAILGLVVSAMCAAASLAQTNARAPACLRDASGVVDYQACADASPHGSPARLLALINLGTEAYLRHDIANAARLYDEAQAESGSQIYSDASFHAFRADAYAHMGRDADALASAQTAFAMVTHAPEVMTGPWAQFASRPVDPEVVYGLILPILKRANDAHFADALAAFTALPIRDYHSYANRSAVIDELGDHQVALQENEKALALAPNDPQVLNNQCFELAELGRGDDALPYCEQVVQLAPDVAPVHDSYAVALAAAGRCAEADRERETAHQLDPAAQAYELSLICTPAH